MAFCPFVVHKHASINPRTVFHHDIANIRRAFSSGKESDQGHRKWISGHRFCMALNRLRSDIDVIVYAGLG